DRSRGARVARALSAVPLRAPDLPRAPRRRARDERAVRGALDWNDGAQIRRLRRPSDLARLQAHLVALPWPRRSRPEGCPWTGYQHWDGSVLAELPSQTTALARPHADTGGHSRTAPRRLTSCNGTSPAITLCERHTSRAPAPDASRGRSPKAIMARGER